MSMLSPRDEADVADAIARHVGPLEVLGAGTKRPVGHAVVGTPLSIAALTGIVDYEPAELVLTVRAGTPLAVLEAALRAAGQRLSFEPPDWSALLGTTPGTQTIGGVLAANLAGSRRVTAGAARDHFLGFRAVSGRGERYKAGGKVVKNVTGFDLPKLLAGSWGTLSVLTEVTLKAMPRPETETTLVFREHDVAAAVARMTAALGSPHEVSAAAHCVGRGETWLRVEGFAPSVAARCTGLEALASRAADARLDAAQSAALWARTANAEEFAGCASVWRLSVPPAESPRVLAALAPRKALLDWGGGLLWLGFDAVDAARVRAAVGTGHATLVKADAATRAAVQVFQPQPIAVAALQARVKAAFDPDNRLNPGRMG